MVRLLLCCANRSYRVVYIETVAGNAKEIESRLAYSIHPHLVVLGTIHLFISPNPHWATSQVQKWKLHVYPCKTTEQHSGNHILKSACHSKKGKTNKNKTKKHVKPDQWNHGGWKCTNYRRHLSYKWYRRSCIFSSNFANYIPTNDIVRQTIIFYYY